ncbi:hypothetical protein DH2020_037999 [Rehmannia glutinosa]|uniref:Phosphoribulokinase/uridine kinase domain-containing protein n=1 Tax=Rehmannia glutinosa TaxID=99300 RepID=A0ABR0V2M5_REHGL
MNQAKVAQARMTISVGPTRLAGRVRFASPCCVSTEKNLLLFIGILQGFSTLAQSELNWRPALKQIHKVLLNWKVTQSVDIRSYRRTFILSKQDDYKSIKILKDLIIQTTVSDSPANPQSIVELESHSVCGYKKLQKNIHSIETRRLQKYKDLKRSHNSDNSLRLSGFSMAQDTVPSAESPRRRSGLLRDQVQLVKRKDSDRYEIARIQDPLSFEKGFFVVVRACQLLAQRNEGMVLVGVAGPSGAGKTVFTEKILNFMPSIAIINMDNYNDATRIIDGNFDDPRLTDYDTLLENIRCLKEGIPVQIPIYDFKSSSRVGYRTLEVPSSRIVIIEGIYALSEKLRPLLDLRVSVTGGVHFDLVKRVLRDIQRAGQEPEEIIHQISETNYFQVSVRLLGGLMALGYTIASILKRSSHVFSNDKICVKTDWLEQLNRKYVQALPDDLKTKLSIDDDLVTSPKEALSRASADRRTKFLNRGVSQSYSTQRDKNLSRLTKLTVNNRRYDGRTPDSPAALANQGIVTHLSEQISTLNERMDEFTSRIEELNSKMSIRKVSASQQNLALQAEACNATAPSSIFANGPLSGPLLPNSSSSSQLARESPIMEEVLFIARAQRQIMHQIDNLSSLLHEYYGERCNQGRTNQTIGGLPDIGSIAIPLLLSLTVGGIGILLLRSVSSQK